VAPPRVLIAYDGSDEAAAAIRAVAALIPDARAVVGHARGDAVALEHAALARGRDARLGHRPLGSGFRA
jgi:hypothetical protein